jgi:hypothetical protein
MSSIRSKVGLAMDAVGRIEDAVDTIAVTLVGTAAPAASEASVPQGPGGLNEELADLVERLTRAASWLEDAAQKLDDTPGPSPRLGLD